MAFVFGVILNVKKKKKQFQFVTCKIQYMGLYCILLLVC